MESNDTVQHLKQQIHEMDGVPINQLALQANGHELDDNSLLRDHKTPSDNLKIEMIIRPSPASSSPASSSLTRSGNIGDDNVNKKLKIMVLYRTKEIPVEVNASDKVGVLKMELTKLQKQFNFELPPEGCLFVHNQRVMDEDGSLGWYQVKQGDSIDVFGGTVTDGSP